MLSKLKVIFIQGPTASGKTQLAIDLALALGGKEHCKIINCDSVQVYKQVQIGTAKPNQEQLNCIDHLLLDFVDYPLEYTAGQFRKDALKLLQEFAEQEIRYCFVVGGTGFYFQALEKGMFDFPPTDETAQKSVYQDLQTKGLEFLFHELQFADPSYASNISANDKYRICKAVEILRCHGKPSELRANFKEEKFPYPLLKINLDTDREFLWPIIQKRTQLMLDQGLVKECQELASRGVKCWAPLRSVGYDEVYSYLNQKISFQEMQDLINIHTWQLAKRQKTWFKRDKSVFTFSIQNKKQLFIDVKKLIETSFT